MNQGRSIGTLVGAVVASVVLHACGAGGEPTLENASVDGVSTFDVTIDQRSDQISTRNPRVISPKPLSAPPA
jgi:hypothetical protein